MSSPCILGTPDRHAGLFSSRTRICLSRAGSAILGAILALSAPLFAEDAPNPAATGKSEPRRPNIVFILADDLGIHDLGSYGRAEHRTPHLDRLAAAGVRFESAYCAQPICSPSRAAILTGKTPARLRLTTYLPGRPDRASQRLLQASIRQFLPLEEVTLAERLRAAGYVTACIGKWHLGGAGFLPTDQGFDVYHAGRAVTKPSETEGGKGEYELTARAEEFIEANRSRPFFLYLAHDSPHIPYSARQGLVAARAGAFEPVYAAVIETLDDTVGRLLAKLDSLGLADDTIVVFTSDNGGLHVSEGGHERITHNTPFRAGKGFLYEGGLRIPLIVRWPGRIPADRTIVDPVVNTDWVPTLLELAGLPAPDARRPEDVLDGESFATMLLEGRDARAESAPRKFFWHFPHYTNQGSRPAGAVREGEWKLIEHTEDGRIELFRLSSDVGETRDLSAAEPERSARLRESLAAWRAKVGAVGNGPNPNFDSALHAKLYRDIDVSRLEPASATAAEPAAKEALRAWRRLMDTVPERSVPKAEEK